MSQVLQTNGNYTIKTSLNGDIILNTGPAVGRVIITGDLVVQGDTTDVNVADLFVEDNVITLNTGETGNGVTKGYAGIEVDRGTEDNASFVYNESTDAWQIVRGQNGTYSFTESNLKLRQLHFVDATGGDPIAPELTIVNAGLGALRLSGRTEYEDYPEPERRRHLLRSYRYCRGLCGRERPTSCFILLRIKQRQQRQWRAYWRSPDSIHQGYC